MKKTGAAVYVAASATFMMGLVESGHGQTGGTSGVGGRCSGTGVTVKVCCKKKVNGFTQTFYICTDNGVTRICGPEKTPIKNSTTQDPNDYYTNCNASGQAS